MASDVITEITDSNFAEEIENGEGLYMVDFWAEWCGPCRMIAPTVDQLATEYQDLYLDPLGEAGRTIDVRELINEDNVAATYLQSNYSINFEPLSAPSAVDDARDGSA